MRRAWIPLALLTLLLPNAAQSDPCGMVPPIPVTGAPPAQLERTGAQRTWVMFKDGVETIALRPGFTGNVEDFGMLIPFPSPPAIRKISDDTFAHLEAAIDPPTLQVHIRERMRPSVMRRGSATGASSAPMMEKSEEPLALDKVVVLSEEAVGMYQVAVLEAGSPKALARWMTDNGYTYPTGMDAVTLDYVQARWCFVAVKARVGPDDGIAPRPGMREVAPELPSGSSYDGFVQGMGFRFATKEPVVPMRLSVFNGEDPRNVVYALMPDPVRIAGVPISTVVRQVDGKALHANLVDPLPVEIDGGKFSDLQDHEKTQVAERRDPSKVNGVARDVISADLMALRSGQLALDVEQKEKEILNVSEALLLRGPAIDALHAEALAEATQAQTGKALGDVKGMTLTVIDGVFPQQLLADQNLTFTTYAMDDAHNLPRQEAIRPAVGSLTFWR